MKSLAHHGGRWPADVALLLAGRPRRTHLPTHSLGPLLTWLDDRMTSVSCVGTGGTPTPSTRSPTPFCCSRAPASGALLRIRLDLLSNRPHLMDYYSLQGTGGAYESSRAEGEPDRVYLKVAHRRTRGSHWRLRRASSSPSGTRGPSPAPGTGVRTRGRSRLRRLRSSAASRNDRHVRGPRHDAARPRLGVLDRPGRRVARGARPTDLDRRHRGRTRQGGSARMTITRTIDVR